MLVLLLSGILVSSIRNLIPYAMRLPMILLLTALASTLADYLLRAFYYEWHLTLGIYVSLLTVNCLILVNAEEYALRHGLKGALKHGLLNGLSVWTMLSLIGLARELVADFNLIIFSSSPGALLSLGLVLALVQLINSKTGAPQT